MKALCRLACVSLLVTGCFQSYDRDDDEDSGSLPDIPYPDEDTDGDCITDEDEVSVFGTDPYDPDTDGDGLTDWAEVETGSDPLDPDNGTDTSRLVVLPYMADGVETREASMRTRLEVADIYFLIDTTGSMDSAIVNVATSLSDVIVPAINDSIADVQMGVGHFNDVPYDMYGDTSDEPFWHIQSITDDIPAVQSALDSLLDPWAMWGSGGDGPESNSIALWCTATGLGFDECGSSVPAQSCPTHPGEAGPRFGYPCFRPGSVPIIVHVTDAPWHGDEYGGNAYECSDSSYGEALDALLAINARHVGVYVNTWSTDGLSTLRQMSRDTESVDGAGSPLVEVAESGMVSTSIVNMIASLAAALPTDVTAEVRDVPGDPAGGEFDATLFVTGIETLAGDPPAPDGFSHMDDMVFYDVVPGTRVSYEITFHNDIVPPRDVAQFFEVWVVLMGLDVAILDQRKFVIAVPPEACHP